MFKKFSQEEISSHTQAKSSVHRNLRKKLLEQFPQLGEGGSDAGAAAAAVDDKDDDSGKAEIDLLMPKKTPLYLIKAPNFVQLLVVKQQALFFNIHDGPCECLSWNHGLCVPVTDANSAWLAHAQLGLPTLRTLHAYPELLPVWRCDAGAVRFLLNGSNVMAPGLTHPKAWMQSGVEKSTPVAVYVDGSTLR